MFDRPYEIVAMLSRRSTIFLIIYDMPHINSNRILRCCTTLLNPFLFLEQIAEQNSGQEVSSALHTSHFSARTYAGAWYNVHPHNKGYNCKPDRGAKWSKARARHFTLGRFLTLHSAPIFHTS